MLSKWKLIWVPLLVFGTGLQWYVVCLLVSFLVVDGLDFAGSTGVKTIMALLLQEFLDCDDIS